jgi:hypothetical protein
MNRKVTNHFLVLAVLAAGVSSGPHLGFCQGTSFTYQGRLSDGANPASGTYDLRFRLFEDPFGDTQAGSGVVSNAVPIANGLFTVSLNFGGALFTGSNYWLEVDVKTNGAGSYAELAPLQMLTPAPYSIMANSASNLLGTLPAVQLNGAVSSANLAGTYSNPLTLNNPANSFVGTFSGNGSGLNSLNLSGTYGNPLTLNNPANNFVGTFSGNGSGLTSLNLSGTYSNALTFSNSADVFVGSFTGDGGGLTNLNFSGPYANAVVLSNGANIFGGTFAGNGRALSNLNLVGIYSNAVAFSNAADMFGGSFSGNGAGLANVNAATLGGLSVGSFWEGLGNAGTSPTNGNFLGTTDNQPLELRVNGQRALRLEPNTNGMPNVIGGAPNNFVDPGIVGATIAGGGALNQTISSFMPGPSSNHVSDIFGTIGGGRLNTVNAGHGTIAGGLENTIYPLAYDGVIGGGFFNVLWTNSFRCVIGGGGANLIGGPALSYSFIGGGFGNTIRGSDAVIGGGSGNQIGANISYSSIGGGLNNGVFESYSSIGGGQGNTIQALADRSVIAGGGSNIIVGSFNFPVYSVIGGGEFNLVQTNGIFSAIGGGLGNTVASNAVCATLSGGASNSVSGVFATVGGGSNNITLGDGGFVGGGINNQAANYSVVGGGQTNIATSPFGTVGGGIANVVTGFVATVSGGGGNSATADHATVSGGLVNVASGIYATVSGGLDNTASGYGSIVAGGTGNTASGYGSIVAGGLGNQANGFASFAAGNSAHALHDGSFVWADDSSPAHFSSTGLNQFLIRAAGGVGIGTTTPQGPLHVVGNQSNLILQNSVSADYWSIYTENCPGCSEGTGNLLFVPNTGIGAFIRRSDGAYISGSDARLKRDITPLGGVLDKLMQLRPVSYQFRNEPANSARSLGLIAQEVEPLFPEVVGEYRGMKGLAYSELVPVTVGAIQELNQKVTEKEAKIQRLEQRNEALEERLEKIERCISQLQSNR